MLAPADVRRYARQIALPELGAEGQSRLRAARVLVVGEEADEAPLGGTVLEVCAAYLAAAGVGEVRRAARPADPAAWLAALGDVSLVVRSGLSDDAMLRTAVRLARPAVVVRAGENGVDLLSFRRHGPCPHAGFPAGTLTGSQAHSPAPPPAAAVVAGTLAAAEALWSLATPDRGPRARLVRLALDGQPALSSDLPWAPECFLCGGQSREASFS